ncbi:CHASE2 domain-containing serine/threonine-protein kinase [Sinimarinibacterium thermocellulolyticum]|uniref:CHASE2 domain-containing protein n=1 Tax=Sinimarinibacterium thermocellulolyticum TaxID=3170016 RepID=A0ABV2A9Y6_9GAMM
MSVKLVERDGFAGLLFAAVFALLAFAVFDRSFESLERYTYDLALRARERAPTEHIRIVAIDDESIRSLGRWPWPRQRQAELIDKLRADGARVIGITVPYSVPESVIGAETLNALRGWLDASPLTQRVPAEIERFGRDLAQAAADHPRLRPLAAAYADSTLARDYTRLITELTARIGLAADQAGAGDAALAAALSAQGRAILPMRFVLGEADGRPPAPLPDYVRRHALTTIAANMDAGAAPLQALGAQMPIATIGDAAAGIGHLHLMADVDGKVRVEPLVLRYDDALYPSLSLLIAAAALELAARDIAVRPGKAVVLGDRVIDTDRALRMRTHFYRERDGGAAFVADSAADVLGGRLPAGRYRDRVVLIGTTAAGSVETFATPVSAATTPVIGLAHAVSTLLQGDFVVRPAWAPWVEGAVFAALASYVALLLPRLATLPAAAVTALLTLLLVTGPFALMVGQGLWIKLSIAAVFLPAGHFFVMLRKRKPDAHPARAGGAQGDAPGAASSRALGLYLQRQGQLDEAFEALRRVRPIDEPLLDQLYGLALDFERDHRFDRAEAVYRYIGAHQPDYRDVHRKLDRAEQPIETEILGEPKAQAQPAGAGAPQGATDIPVSTLGRYQIDRTLGKGSMGVVYLGRDPKIGRRVAIKTLALSQEFAADKLAGVKERFFREAETAGRLHHPNIVAIYDVGEQDGLAYIAMEFVDGHDLTRHVKPDALLPVPEVLRLIADAADALDYAHGNGIVHRDVKPANMMLVAASRTVKLMDFGIARLTDSSKTKTGTILGSPSYMSPEQIAGKRVDGRSDLFSLGVTLYQLLTGALPFQANSMVNLMMRIAAEPHPPILTLRPDLPAAIVPIIDRLLEKSADARYARGAEVARDLRAAAA